MSLKFVILGFLSEESLTGYDLKKKISASEIFYWSGSNNQIYKSLVKLHEEALVTVDVEYQEGKPPRKVYTITEDGVRELHQWIGTVPALPQFQNELLMKLIWAERLEPDAFKTMLKNYEEELQVRIAMLQEQITRAENAPPSYATSATAHFIALHEFELNWVQKLLQDMDDT